MQKHCSCNLMESRGGIIDESSINLPVLPYVILHPAVLTIKQTNFHLLSSRDPSSTRSQTMASREKETAALATLFNPLVKNEQDLLTFSTTFCSHNAGDLSLVQRRNPSKGKEIPFPQIVHHQPGLIKTPSSIVALQLNDTVSSQS